MTGGALQDNGGNDQLPISRNLFQRSMKLCALSLCFFLIVPFATAYQYNDEPLAVNQGPEAQFLELVDLVAEPAKQLTLLDTFVGQFPKYAAMSTVHVQRQELFVTLSQWDQALEVGAKLLALDESDIETVRRNLKAAHGKGDATLISKWTLRLKQLEPEEGAVTVASTVRLPFVDDIPADLAAVDLSTIPKQHRNRVEAYLFNQAVEEKDIPRKLQLLSLFERQFPTSAHLGKIRYLFFLTYLQKQDHAKALAAAEAMLERDKSREDVIFYAAQTHFVSKREPEKVLTLTNMLLELAQSKAKPDEMTEDAWEKQKKLMISQAHWMMGSIQMQNGRWSEADKAMRQALTSSAGELTELITLNLGWANYKLRNIEEALRFYKQCVAMRGASQTSAAQSIASIKAEYKLP